MKSVRLDDRATFVVAHVVLAVAVFACFSPGIDNFFAGDDFNWLFDGLKAIHNPSHFFQPLNSFLRQTELSFFVVITLLAGFAPAPFFLGAILIHAVNAVLVSLFVARVSDDRTAGLLGGVFWGLNYKHAEVALQPYGVADSLALCFGLGAVLLVLRERTFLASASYAIALFAKENAVVFPLIAVVCLLHRGKKGIKETLPLWVMALAFTAAEAVVRTRSSRYLFVDSRILSRLWENMLSYVGPDAVWVKQMVLDGQDTLLPAWLAAALLVPLAVAVWKLPGAYRVGLLWVCITMAPTLPIVHQSSRYLYVPLVGVAVVFGTGVRDLLARFQRRGARLAPATVILAATMLFAYFVVGVQLEEQDYERYGEIHRQAAISLQHHIMPRMTRQPDAMAVFVRTPNLHLAQELFPPRPWYVPSTFKWVFRRSYGILGLTNTYAFVTYCAHGEIEPAALFVRVPHEEFRASMARGDFDVILHDSDTNSFSVVTGRVRQDLVGRVDDSELYHLLQPGRFDPSCRGTQYYE